MSRSGKVTVWVSIFSTLFMGCYSSELIDMKQPPLQEENKHQPRIQEVIEYVVTRNGEQYHFAKPPTLVKDSIGNVRSTDIEYVIMKDGTKCTFDELTGIAITPIAKVKTNSTAIDYVIAEDGTKYMFEDTPVVVNDTIVGVLKAKAAPGFADDPTAWSTADKGTQVSIPLSDVAEVSVKEYDSGMTAVVVVVVLGGLVLLGYLAVSSGMGSMLPDLGGN